jgi:hypothetical protein
LDNPVTVMGEEPWNVSCLNALPMSLLVTMELCVSFSLATKQRIAEPLQHWAYNLYGS